MALEKTWGYDDNRVHGDTSSAANQTAWFIWYALGVLTGLIGLVDQNGNALSPVGLQDWVVAQSSNGATAGAGDNVNLATWTPTDWVWSSTARTWVLLYNARLGLWWLVDLCGNAQNIRCSLLLTTPTTGTTSAPPTSTIQIWAQGANATTGFTIFDTTAGVARHVRAKVAADGSFFILCSKDTSGAHQSVFWLHKLTSLQTGDNYPWMMSAAYQSVGIFKGSDLFGNVTGGGGWGYDNGSVQQIWPMILSRPNGSPAGGGMVDAVQNADGTWPEQYIFWQTATGKRIKGRSQDWLFVPSANGDGFLTPTSGAPYLQSQVGFTLVPGRVAPTL